MTQTLPKLSRLDNPATADSFGIAETVLGHIFCAWQGDMLVRLTILPAGAEEKPELLLGDLEMPMDLPADNQRAKDFTRNILFDNHNWQGVFPADLHLAFHGTDFQYAVMQHMLKIPVGKTVSYNGLAKNAGTENAARAVGSICASNPLPLVVPCHRVLPSTGEIGNYGYGPAMKRQLLRWENADIAQ